MALLKCKMCGGNIILSSDRTLGTCEYCRSTTTIPKIDDEQRTAAFNRGNHFRRIGEFDKALAVYERIVMEDNTDAEAHWCCTLCRFGIEYVEDPTTYEWIPTCHRASFDSILDDIDYLAAIEYSDGITQRQYQKEAAKISEIQRDILTTSQNEEPFDVFICYKESDENGNRTVDSTLAQDIYYQLNDKGYRVFFSRITLEDMVGTQYEPYIFAALNSAKVMIVVGTKPEYLNAVWVKNEWSRYLALMKNDRTKVILPCYRDMDPYDMPEALSVLQAYDMSKIGFIQDLLRGIEKIVNKNIQSKANTREAVHQDTDSRSTAMIKRGYLALEDCEWEKAQEFFDQSLNLDAENSEAYVGLFLAEHRLCTLEEFVESKLINFSNVRIEKKNIPVSGKANYAMQNFPIENYLDNLTIERFFLYDLTYDSFVSGMQEMYDTTVGLFNSDKNLKNAVRFANHNSKASIIKVQEEIIGHLKKQLVLSEQDEEGKKNELETSYNMYIEKKYIEAESLYNKVSEGREKDYIQAYNMYSNASCCEDYQKAAEKFKQIGNYKDSIEKANECVQVYEKLAEENRQKQELENYKKERNKRIKELVVVLSIVTLAVLIIYVIIPFINNVTTLASAKELVMKGDFYQASLLLDEVKGYSPADKLKNEIRDDIYDTAIEQIYAGEYLKANRRFEYLGEYEDAKRYEVLSEVLVDVSELSNNDNSNRNLNLIFESIDSIDDLKGAELIYEHEIINTVARLNGTLVLYGYRHVMNENITYYEEEKEIVDMRDGATIDYKMGEESLMPMYMCNSELYITIPIVSWTSYKVHEIKDNEIIIFDNSDLKYYYFKIK